MSDSDSETDDVEEYDAFAQPTLIDQLKKILDEYPDDGQIIKELIQNADDAGATCMKILYMGKTVNPQQNDEKKYRKFLRGPALVFHNDAEFKDADWTGIRTIYNSVKADDPLTVGRFGLGFKSVFHITDYPCIISGDRIMFLNPLEKKSHKVCVTIQLQKLKKSKTVDMEDVVTALDGVFGFSENSTKNERYQGTIFWFPLRSEATKLSANLYPEGRVMDLFKAFMSDAETSLLFLKGLQNIKLYCSMDSSRNTETYYHENVSRFQDFSYGSEHDFFCVEMRQSHRVDNDSKTSFIKEIYELNGSLPPKTLFKPIRSELCLTQRQKDKKEIVVFQNWLVLLYYPGKEHLPEHVKMLLDDRNLCYSPFVAVAGRTETSSNLYTYNKGKIFCFQPLPEEMENQTGLPVHINAFFALTQNRRHVKLPSAEQENFKMQVAQPIQWNKTLMLDILPDAYVKLIVGIIQSFKEQHKGECLASLVYNTIPDLEKTNRKWIAHAEKVITLLMNQSFLYTRANGGEWISANEATFALQNCPNAVQDLLLHNDVKLVLVPHHILSAVEERVTLTKVCPEFILKFMQEEKSYNFLSFQQKTELLHYLCRSDCRRQLHGLKLMPLQDETFTSFDTKGAIYLEKPEIVDLFPGLEDHFISTMVDEQIVKLFDEFEKTGYYQIRKLDVTATNRLGSVLIEKDFETLNTPIKVNKNKGKRWKVWLKDFWSFIIDRFNDNIDLFADLPIYPIFSKRAWSKVQSFCLYALSDNLLYPVDQDGKQLSSEYCCLFELLSMNVIQSIPDWIDMTAIDKFVYKCTGPSLAVLIGKLSSNNVQYFNREATSAQKCLLLTFIAPKFTEDMLKEDARHVLSELKIFKEKTSCSSDFKLVSAKSSTGIHNCENFPVAFPRPLLQLEPNEEQFVGIFGVRQLSLESLIVDTLQVIKTYSLEDTVAFVHWILTKRYHDLSERVTRLLESTEFLTVNEKLFRPCELFDPSDSLLRTLFAGFDLFPTDKRFTEEKMIYALRDIGLKTKAGVTVEDVYKICKRIHNSGSYKKDHKTAMSVLKFLNLSENEMLLQEVQVSNLNWIPIHDESKTELLQYNKGRPTLVSPFEVRSLEFRDIIGSVLPLINCKKYDLVAKCFNWTRKPDLEDVASQLKTIVQHYTSKRKAEFLHYVTAIYTWFDSVKNPLKVEKALNETFRDNNFTCVWTGFGFVSPKDVIVNRHHGDVDLEPYFWILPNELMHLKDFFLEIGCRKQQETTDYTNILAQIKKDSDENELENTSDLLQLAINILNKIKDKIEHGDIKGHDTIFVPVQSDKLLMMPATKCTYGNRDESIEEGLLCVHDDVPVSTAEAVGVQSFKQQMMSELEGLEEWGQTEPLTRRLHNLLKEGYVDGFSVPKELFQNADDAKATKLWILYDERENEDSRTDLLNDAMSEVQGPAVWVYNDAVFTEADFKNITKLSGATKQPDTSKIGRFGLGFCSVYNLTDVPSFLSDESFVIFDPHTTYLG